ncbi:hypothetical protein NL676_033196 [Syzygium grande]|nr:hypothetical protein NL676_033196 [Syzygium grande]
MHQRIKGRVASGGDPTKLYEPPPHEEDGVNNDQAIDAPGGLFLFEWWSVFWDIFIARTNAKHSDAAAAYIEQSKGMMGQPSPRSSRQMPPQPALATL